MLDGAQETRFRYFMEQILVEDGGMPAEEARPFIQGLWTQGFRNGLDEAKVWLKDKASEGVVDDGQQDQILRLMNRYKRLR